MSYWHLCSNVHCRIERSHTRNVRGTRLDCTGNAEKFHAFIWFGSLLYCTFKSGPNHLDNVMESQQLQYCPERALARKENSMRKKKKPSSSIDQDHNRKSTPTVGLFITSTNKQLQYIVLWPCIISTCTSSRLHVLTRFPKTFFSFFLVYLCFFGYMLLAFISFFPT